MSFQVHCFVICICYEMTTISLLSNAEFQRIARRDKKAFFSDQCKDIQENTEWERLGISSRKSEIPKEHFMQRWA